MTHPKNQRKTNGHAGPHGRSNGSCDRQEVTGHAPASMAGKSSERDGETEPIPGGEFPLPDNPGDFVEEIHRRADLFIVWQKLLKSKDLKIKQRAVERLTDLRYKSLADQTEEPQQFIFDMPRPNRD